MAASPQPVIVHSVAEAYLYLLVRPCPVCGSGPLKQTTDLTKTADAWGIDACCGACRRSDHISYLIDPPPTRQQARSDVINPTSQPSRAIDLLGWLTLFQNIFSASQKSTDRAESRQLALEAAQCIDEAMKFYPPDNDLPPEHAFFSLESLRRFKEHPAHFSKSAWRERRLKLPSLNARTAPERRRRHWWQLWKTSH